MFEESYRLYNCARCHRLVKICPRCDHGNIYCNQGCAEIQRRETLCRAGRRYQATFRGRRNHAARQMAYRERQIRKVTHHGFPKTREPVTVGTARTGVVESATASQRRELRDELAEILGYELGDHARIDPVVGDGSGTGGVAGVTCHIVLNPSC